MTIKLKISSLLATAVFCVANTHAAEVQWGGFGTLGAGQTLNSDDARYDARPMLNDGDLDDKLTFNVLSVVGLQADVKISDGLSATVQLKAEGSDNWDANVAWAYVTYEMTPNLKVQAGRKLIPVYSYTDSIDVGYTYHWIRPPGDVYGVAAISYDGVNVAYQGFVGDWEVTGNGLVGRVEDDEGMYANFTTSYRVWGGNVEATYDDWVKLRLAAMRYEDFLLDGEIGGEGSGLRIAPFNSVYYGTSLSLTPANWLLIAEYTWYDADVENLIPGVPGTKLLNNLDEAWYVSAAYTTGKWTPHLTYSHSEFADEGYNLGSVANEYSTIIAGLRYDFLPSASLKFEYHIKDDDSQTNGVDTPLRGHDSVDAIQVAIDFIF